MVVFRGNKEPAVWGFVRHSILAIVAVLAVVRTNVAHAERLSFRNFGGSEGLTSLTGECMTHDRAGRVLVCSEHGVYVFNGRRFVNLGAAQGLRDGGIVYDLTVSDDGRIAVRYADAIFVSDLPATSNSPTGLVFRPVRLGQSTLYRERGWQIAAWHGGFVVVIGHRTMRVRADANEARLVDMDYDRSEQAALDDPVAIFSANGRLWETFDDGRVCSADPGFVTCYGRAQGLSLGPWMDVIAGSDGTVLLRSLSTMATIDPRVGRVTEATLPAQGGRYRNYVDQIGMFRTPSGDLVTQSNDGLIIRKPSGWTQLKTEDGLPPGIIVTAMPDEDGQMWFQVLGRGLFVTPGYGHWEALQKSDGLSDTVTWQAVRSRTNGLWVSTDDGIDEVLTVNGTLRATRTVPGAAFALAIGPDGRVWSSAGDRDVTVTDPSTGRSLLVAAPAVDAIVAGQGRRVWLGTERGLYVADVPSAGPPVAVRDGPPGPVAAALSDAIGGVWLLSDGRLWHRRADGSRVLVGGDWPTGGFEPVAMAMAGDRRLWIGGAGGLVHVGIRNDQVVSMQTVAPSDIQSSSVVAVMVDHRGWVWVGTGMGVSVFNGQRWASATTENGLVWNDVSQGGITEDGDGSIWIATSGGISHLRDPSWLFDASPLRIVIAEARLGDIDLPAARVPFTDAALSLGLGTFGHCLGRSIVFRYRMSGVDQNWVETASGSARYPFVPPGRHELTVIGYDVLDHQASAPVTLTIDMDFPWWRRWWADALFTLLTGGATLAAIRLRMRDGLLRRRELERLVGERTREMDRAHAELRRQATLDGLTGLLNRKEVQRRLAERLNARGDPGEIIVALLDLDHFKKVNDEYGHLAGDDVLQLTGVRVSAILREREYAGRYGGEEILVVLDDADGQGADRILGLHQSIRRAPFFVDNTEIPVTCSIGLTWAGVGDDWKSLIRRADAALYEAKISGRDRVEEQRCDEHAGPLVWPGRHRSWGDAAGV